MATFVDADSEGPPTNPSADELKTLTGTASDGPGSRRSRVAVGNAMVGFLMKALELKASLALPDKFIAQKGSNAVRVSLQLAFGARHYGLG